MINLLLVALIGAAGYELHRRWKDAGANERQALSRSPAPAILPAMPQAAKSEPVRPANYFEVAQKLLFAKDRNPTVVVEVAPPKPMPALPYVYGVLDIGDGPTAFMALRGQGQKGIRPGDQIGEFKLLAASHDQITLEWDGQKLTKKVAELRDRDNSAPVAAPAAAAPVAANATPPPPQPSTTPGADAGNGTRMCMAGDNSPAGTTADGYRKVLQRSAFGTYCFWEPAK